jgi:ABC-type dipeptide/oligopeptide/nickel transport system permease subunit
VSRDLAAPRTLWARLRRDRLALVGAGIVCLLLGVAGLAPVLAPRDPAKQSLSLRLEPPSRLYWLGGDELGRDVLSRVIFGTRVELAVATSSVALSLLLGTALGATAGYAQGRADDVIMRVLDILLAFPALLLGIVVVTALGVGVGSIVVAVGLWATPGVARLVRGLVLHLHRQEFVDAARAMGAGPHRILLRHILPNSVPVLVVYSALYVANAILLEAGLSFLGLGVRPPTASWGLMISTGREYLLQAPLITVSAGVAISVSVLGFNLFADGLRDALDVRMAS